jgi:tRNA 2-selenouridine synthase
MQDFSSYDLIIDARSEREYTEDHIPGAVNLPVVKDDEYAEVGTTHRDDKHKAYLIGVSYSLRNIADAIDSLIRDYPRRARMLVYCLRGGKRSRLWFDALDTIGYRVERLQGGWKAYRRWVNDQLATLPQQLTYHVLCGPTGCGKTRLLQALRLAGAQVLDLEELAKHRGSLIGAIPGVEQPGQKWFESLVLAELMKFDPVRPVWVEAESKKIGQRQVPPALFAAMHAGIPLRVEAPMPERVKLWREDYSHFEEHPDTLIEQLRHLRALVGNEELAAWKALAEARQMPTLFERLMVAHYDPAYRRSTLRHYPEIDNAKEVRLASLDPMALREIASQLAKLRAERVGTN